MVQAQIVMSCGSLVVAMPTQLLYHLFQMSHVDQMALPGHLHEEHTNTHNIIYAYINTAKLCKLA